MYKQVFSKKDILKGTSSGHRCSRIPEVYIQELGFIKPKFNGCIMQRL